MKNANYSIAKEDEASVTLRDEGPWNTCLTITNDIEHVVETLPFDLCGRRLFYYDSNGDLDEVIVDDGKFVSFAGGPR